MASGVCDFGASTWLAALFGVISPVTSYYIALLTDQPGLDADGTVIAQLEPIDSVYNRQSYAAGAGTWDLNGAYLTNTVAVAFGIPTIGWGAITHYALCTAASGGDLYAFGEFLSPQVITPSFAVTVPAGGIVLSLHSLENSIAI